jgi:hypothetical protein
MAHAIGADEEERQVLFVEACEAIEGKLQEQNRTMRAAELVREVNVESKQLNRDMVQQALWSLIGAGRVKVNDKFEVSLLEPPGVV